MHTHLCLPLCFRHGGFDRKIHCISCPTLTLYHRRVTWWRTAFRHDLASGCAHLVVLFLPVPMFVRVPCIFCGCISRIGATFPTSRLPHTAFFSARRARHASHTHTRTPPHTRCRCCAAGCTPASGALHTHKRDDDRTLDVSILCMRFLMVSVIHWNDSLHYGHSLQTPVSCSL